MPNTQFGLLQLTYARFLQGVGKASFFSSFIFAGRMDNWKTRLQHAGTQKSLAPTNGFAFPQALLRMRQVARD